MSDPTDSNYETEMIKDWHPKSVDSDEEYQRAADLELEAEAEDPES